MFQFIIDELEYGSYLGWPLPPSLWKLILVQDNERVVAARRARDPAPTGGEGIAGGAGAAVLG